MSTTKIPPGNGIKQLFQKEGRFLTGQVGINISVEVPKNSDLALALLNNTPFPRRIIKLSQIGVKIDGNPRDVKFGDGQGTVSFDGSGAFGSGLGVYEDVSELLADLDPDKKVLGELDISATGIKRFVVLNWNYNLTVSVNGAMALGGGLGITFRAGGRPVDFSQSFGVLARTLRLGMPSPKLWRVGCCLANSGQWPTWSREAG